MQHNLDQRLPDLFRKNGVFRTAAVLAIACLFLLASCGTSSTTQQPGVKIKRGGTLNVGLIAEPSVLDPLTSVTLYDGDIMVNM